MLKIIAALPIVFILLGVQLAYAAKDPLVFITATVSPDNSNEFIHNQFKVDSFRFLTSDTTICPAGMLPPNLNGCTYELSKGDWRANTFGSDAFVFEGSLKATSGSGSNFYEIRADLNRVSQNTTANGHTVDTMTGTISFGNGVADYNIPFASFDSTNSTLKLLGLNTQ